MIDETIVVHAYFPSYHVSREDGMDYLPTKNIRYYLQRPGI